MRLDQVAEILTCTSLEDKDTFGQLSIVGSTNTMRYFKKMFPDLKET